MRFLVNAQLPRRLASFLQQAGHEAIHTLDLPEGNRTPDEEIEATSREQHAVLVTKDRGFIHHLALGTGAYKLLLISTGNISNDELLSLFVGHLADVEMALEGHAFVELTRERLIVHW
jgi:predicted nuclease of predicted toxin-antitoxin system